MRAAIENRISRRAFLDAPFTEAEQADLRSRISEINKRSGLSLEFIEDGQAAFQSFRKSYGMFKNVRSMILLKGRTELKNLDEKIGYYGEDLILDLTDLGYGSCWVGGTFDRSFFPVAEGERHLGVIVIGKVPTLSMKEKLFRSAVSKRRKPLEERLEAVGEIPQWVLDGMEAVRLAPSAINSQKPKFHYDGELWADVKVSYSFDLVDLGIAKRHFEIEAKGRFEEGNGKKFHKA